MDKKELTLSDRIRSVWAASVFLGLIVICTPVCILIVLLTFGSATDMVVTHIGSFMGRTTLKAAGISFRINHHNPDFAQPSIYIINHKTTLDLILYLAIGLPRIRFVAKRELQYNPFFYVLGKITGQIFIDRAKTEKAVQRLRETYQHVKQNKLSILLAPEGTRKHKGTIGQFKKGPFRMAMDLGYPIVPIYVEGARHLNGTTNIWLKKGTITVHIYPPVTTEKWSLGELEFHISKIRHRYLEWAEMDTREKALST